MQRCDGSAELGIARRGEQSVLAHLYQHDPCRVLFPRVEAGEPPEAVFVTTSGGLAGGDRIALTVEIGAQAAATVTTQAAEKIYRSLGENCRIDVALRVAPGAVLDWLPQQTILFDGARLARRTQCDIAEGGRLLAAETVVFGRAARGERFASGALHDAWRVRLGGRLIWADALRLGDDLAGAFAARAALDGAGAVATLLYVGDDAATHLDAARALLEEASCHAGVSLVGGMLLARLIGRDATALRSELITLLDGLRSRIAGRPRALPRVWAI